MTAPDITSSPASDSVLDATGSPVTTTDAVEPDDSCAACAHSLSSHDAISLRYCQATVRAALSRSCICPV